MHQYPHYDRALQNLIIIKADFEEFCRNRGSATEADTRVKVIDRILKEVLFWSDNSIMREKYVKSEQKGYVDYVFDWADKKYIIIEAKKEGASFNLPRKNTVSIKSLLKTKDELSDTVLQTKNYCDEMGADFGIATNGYSWAIFKPYPSGRRWDEGMAIIFRSIDEIIDDFPRFWELLNIDGIRNSSLEKALSTSKNEERDYLFNRLKRDFDIDNYINNDRFLKFINDYNGQELPIAKAKFVKSGYQVDEKKFYFDGELYSWFRPLHKYNEKIRLDCDNLFIEADEELAGDIFQDRENCEIVAVVEIIGEHIYFKSYRLHQIEKDCYYKIYGLTNPYPAKTIKVSNYPLRGMNIDSSKGEVYIVNNIGEYFCLNYDDMEVKKRLQIPISKEEEIEEAKISPNGEKIILILNNGSDTNLKFLKVKGKRQRIST